MMESDRDTKSPQKRERESKRKEVGLQHHLQSQLAAILWSMRWAESAPRVSINTNQWQVGICPLLKQHLAVPVQQSHLSHQSQCTHMHRHPCSARLPHTHPPTHTHQKKLNKCGNRCPTSDCTCPLLSAQLQGDNGIPLTKIRHCSPLLSLLTQVCVWRTHFPSFINVHIRSYPDAIGEPAGRACLFLNPNTKSHPFRKHTDTCSHTAALWTVQLCVPYKNDGDRLERQNAAWQSDSIQL